ncbi:MFS transporter [Mesorhizobium sp. NBSH29]|uniref:MFS transporter n=1 Tax=Mesorhizobium sp. NBSH29 TaxID=2654249 RepID=UPI0018968A16|nr:MFS transporter [Mesorhizobium sp. NBSH29]QPC88290.1 MFS transporter [Mesorhizobium sp. NBSH29]
MITLRRTIRRPPVLATLAAATVLASLGISVVSVALPSLATGFSASVSAVQWVVLGYLVSVTVTIVIAGRLGDLFGHKRTLVAGLAIFTLASVLSAASPTLMALIASRILQGIGGAILIALPVSMARGAVAKNRLGSAMGLLATMSAIGTSLGPSVGGFIIAAIGWRATFIPLAGLGAVVLCLAVCTVPPDPDRDRQKSPSMDWPGALLLALCLTSLALATSGGSAGWSAGLLLLFSAATLACLVIVETRTASPLVPMAMLRGAAATIPLGLSVLVATVMMSTLAVGPFFLSFGLNLYDWQVGLVMAVGPAMSALAGVPAGRLTDRFGARRIVLAGLALTFVGLICLAMFPRLFGTAGYVVALILLTPGFQLFLAANNTVVMASTAADQRGLVSGLLGLSRNLGFMAGASMMPMLFAATMAPAQITTAPPQAVADAFTITFIAAAGGIFLALLLATISHRKHAQESAAKLVPDAP